MVIEVTLLMTLSHSFPIFGHCKPPRTLFSVGLPIFGVFGVAILVILGLTLAILRIGSILRLPLGRKPVILVVVGFLHTLSVLGIIGVSPSLPGIAFISSPGFDGSWRTGRFRDSANTSDPSLRECAR
jgi:hypothetical protein